MKILWLKYSDSDSPLEGWDFSRIELTNINLFVGESGSGKTRLLNVIFNIGSKVRNDLTNIAGFWQISFEHRNVKYFWEYEAKRNSKNEIVITKEFIKKTEPDESEEILVHRNEGSFNFMGKDLPKLSTKSTSIFILKEDPTIEPIFEAFGQIVRRRFFGDELERAASYEGIPPQLIPVVGKKNEMMTLLSVDQSLSLRLYLIKNYFPDKYKVIVGYFKSIFAFIESCDLKDLSDIQKHISLPGRVPVFVIKERGVTTPITIQNISSGMQKVLLIITDVVSLPMESLYLIDEYENSLGINAINFLPSFLADYGTGRQFIITSHHPYLVNAIPVKHWFVFHRNGSIVKIKYGRDMEASYGKSKQQAFIKLINDPFYSDGIE